MFHFLSRMLLDTTQIQLIYTLLHLPYNCFSYFKWKFILFTAQNSLGKLPNLEVTGGAMNKIHDVHIEMSRIWLTNHVIISMKKL